SLAKREEVIFIPGNKEPFLLPEDSEMLYLIQRIRDEAHRFAVTFHKKLREKLIKKSVIDFIPGIGEKKKMMLLKKFKSVNAIKIAQINELTEIPGIGKNTAVKIKTVLEARDDFKLSE
ncbi:MAG: helix-hairpin-helix domain-containing protein, partial [Atribacterota bacterium]|nr:helix-hairpin-helix domain-containing protein [Atribacterota bacterium]